MTVLEKLRKMSAEELAILLYCDLSGFDCSNCILNNLNKMQFCNNKRDCISSIKKYLESEVSNEYQTIEEWKSKH